MSFRSIILGNCSDIVSAQDAIDRYFYREEFTGSKFEIVADNDTPNQFTARDVVAVSMLSVNIPPKISFWLLNGEGARQTGELLRQVPSNIDIWDAAEYISRDKPLYQLWVLLQKQLGGKFEGRINNTLCSKLLAAKRPRLVPIMDSVVEGVFGCSDDYWRDFRVALSSPLDRSVIEAATSNAPEHISLLRRIDVVIWMLHHKKFMVTASKFRRARRP